MRRIVVMTGGGIKGGVAAARSAAENDLVLVHVDYGQPSAPAELSALRSLAKTFPSARVVTLTMPHVLELDRVETRTKPGHGDSDVSRAPSAGALRGLVPVLLSVGVQCALRVGASSIVTGLSRFCDAAHLGLGGTGAVPDGGREFVHSFNLMIESLSQAWSKIRVEAPLMDLSSPQIIKLGQRFGVPLENTWTCLQTRPQPCGRCAPCLARASAFVDASLVDPLISPVSVSA